MSDGIRLYLILPDIHLRPGHTWSKAVRCALAVMREVRPYGIVLLGDTVDMESICHHNRYRSRLLEAKRYYKDIAELEEFLDEIDSCPSVREKYYHIGNHEHWIQQYVDSHPECEGNMDIIQDARLEERGYTVIPFNHVQKLGRASFMHGMYTNKYHANKTVMEFQRNIFYGHAHDHQSYTWITPTDVNEKYKAMSLGCLCDLNPAWMRNKPSRWVHMFGMFYLRPNGTFQMNPIVIIKGKCIVNGKEIGFND